jgi:septum site-determining protein MinD
MTSPYIIRISSQKGGVGKTTVAANVGVALSLFGYKVLIVDSDAANPSVGFHLGMNQANVGYKEVVNGQVKLDEAIAMHAPSGLRVLPGAIGPYSFIPTEINNRKFLKMLSETKYNFIIIDTSPGYAFTEPYEYYSEALIITTADASSCTAAVRLARTYNQQKLKHNLVVNRIKRRKYEYNIEEIEDMYENRVLGVLPEDEAVPQSIAQHIPVYLLNPKANFSTSIKNLSRRYSSRTDVIDVEGNRSSTGGSVGGFIRRLLGRQ